MPDPNELARKIGPAVAALVQACNSMGINVTGFIANPDSDDLVRFGNIEHVNGMDFVRLNASLAWISAIAHEQGEISHFEQPLGTQGQDPLEIADKLAMAAIMVGPSAIPDRVLALAREYTDLRSESNA